MEWQTIEAKMLTNLLLIHLLRNKKNLVNIL